jgi:hypothetical protein
MHHYLVYWLMYFFTFWLIDLFVLFNKRLLAQEQINKSEDKEGLGSDCSSVCLICVNNLE